MKENKTKALFVATLILLLIGLIASIYLTHLYFAVQNAGGEKVESFCSLSETIDCVSVEQSEWSRILGIPVAVWGDEFYIVALLSLLLSFFGIWPVRSWQSLTFWFVMLTLPGVVGLFLLATLVIGSLCIICCVVYTVNISTFALLLFANRKQLRELFAAAPREVWQTISSSRGWLAFFVLFVAAMLSQFLWAPGFFADDANAATVRNWKGLTVQGATVGTPDAPIHIQEFTDFQCPYCGKAHNVMLDLLARYPGKIFFEHRDYPLDRSCNANIKRDFHRYACLSAKYAHCAEQQGRFWPMDALLFDAKGKLAQPYLDHYAEQVGLRKNDLQQCLTDPATDAAIQQDIRDGAALGISGTPAFVVNGELIVGYRDLAYWTEKIDSLLAETPK